MSFKKFISAGRNQNGSSFIKKHKWLDDKYKYLQTSLRKKV